MTLRNALMAAVMTAAFALPALPILTPSAQAAVSAADAQERGRGEWRGGQNRGARGDSNRGPRAGQRGPSSRERGELRGGPRAGGNDRRDWSRDNRSDRRVSRSDRRPDFNRPDRDRRPGADRGRDNRPGFNRGDRDRRPDFNRGDRNRQVSRGDRDRRYTPPPRSNVRVHRPDRRYSAPSRNVRHYRPAPNRHYSPPRRHVRYSPPRRVVHTSYSPRPSWRYHNRYRSNYRNTNFYYADGFCNSGSGLATGALAGALIGGLATESSGGVLAGGLIGAGLGSTLNSCDRGQYHYAAYNAFNTGNPYHWHNPHSGVRGVIRARDFHNWNNQRCRWGDAEIFLPNGQVSYDRVRMCQDRYGYWQVARVQ